MPSLVSKWKNHLKENNMTYWGHCVFAVGHGVRCIKAGVYLCIHGILPCYYRRAGSKLVRHLAKVFTDHDYEIEGEKMKEPKRRPMSNGPREQDKEPKRIPLKAKDENKNKG